MKAFWLMFCAAMLLAFSGCGPLTSLACDRANVLCGNVDLEICEATLESVPPRTRSHIVSCTSAARGCGEATDCFTRNQLALPTYD